MLFIYYVVIYSFFLKSGILFKKSRFYSKKVLKKCIITKRKGEEKMTDSLLSDLVELYDYDDIHGMYKRLYPTDYARNAYQVEMSYRTIKELADVEDSDYTIHVSLSDETSEDWENVYGTKGSDDFERYVLSYQPWSEWLGMRISVKTMNTYSVAEILSYCLHEMTIHGYVEDDIKEKRYRKLKEEGNTGEKPLSPTGKELYYDEIDDEEEGLADLRNQLKYEIKSSSESLDKPE